MYSNGRTTQFLAFATGIPARILLQHAFHRDVQLEAYHCHPKRSFGKKCYRSASAHASAACPSRETRKHWVSDATMPSADRDQDVGRMERAYKKRLLALA